MGSKYLYSYCLVGCCFQDLLKKHAASLSSSHLAHSPSVLLVKVVQLYSNTDTNIVWKNSHFILSE